MNPSNLYFAIDEIFHNSVITLLSTAKDGVPQTNHFNPLIMHGTIFLTVL